MTVHTVEVTQFCQPRWDSLIIHVMSIVTLARGPDKLIRCRDLSITAVGQ